MKTRALTLALASALALLVSTGPSVHAQDDARSQQFEELAQRVQQGVGNPTPDDLKKLLDMAKELGNPYRAHVAVKGYVGRNQQLPDALLLQAADNAWLAGDLRTAVSRYRDYLKDAKPSEQTAHAAARLYQTTLELLGRNDEAYDAMAAFGDTHRGSAAARSYDSWFTGQAARKSDAPALASRLVTIFGEKHPIEMEREFFWNDLDSLMDDIAQARQSEFGALRSANDLAPLIRGDKARSGRMGFLAANLAYHAQAAGKGEEALAASFEPVIAAAKTYFNAAPRASTLQDIYVTWMGGEPRFDEGRVAQHRAMKNAFLAEAMPKLSKDEQLKILAFNHPRHNRDMVPYVADAEGWLEVAPSMKAAIAESPHAGRIPVVKAADSFEVYKKQASYLDGVDASNAAVVNSLAAGPDATAVVRHLLKGESWHLDGNQIWSVLGGDVYTGLRHTAGATEREFSNNDWEAALATIGKENIAGSPLAVIDPSATSNYLVAAFNQAGGTSNDKSSFVEHLNALAWVPYTDEQRQNVIRPAYEQFTKWTAQMRKDEEKNKAALAQVSKLEGDFKAAMEGGKGAAAAPNELTKTLAQFVSAGRDGRVAEYEQLGKKLYDQVKDFDNKKTAFGWPVVEFVLNFTPGNVDNFSTQMAVLSDRLSRVVPNDQKPWARRTVDEIFDSRRAWRNWNFAKDEAPRVKTLHGVFGDALLAQVEKHGKVDGTTLYWFRASRAGSGFNHSGARTDVIAGIINKDALRGTDVRVGGEMATTSYMYMVRHEFTDLQKQFSLDKDFDDLYVKEAADTNMVDWNYFNRSGRDHQGKVTDASAQVLLGVDNVPPHYGDGAKGVNFTRDEYWRWFSRALQYSNKHRDALMAKAESAWGKTRFDSYAMGRGYFERDAKADNPAGRKAFFEKLATYLERAKTVPTRVHPPTMRGLQGIDGESLSADELNTLLAIFPNATPTDWHRGWYVHDMAWALQTGLVSQDRTAELYEVVPFFWAIGRDTTEAGYQRSLAEFAKQQLDAENADLAMAYADTALRMQGSDRPLPADVDTSLNQTRTRALASVGDAIPVARSHPHYPLYASQAAYLAGDQGSAWQQYQNRKDLLSAMFKDLDASYLVWVIRRHTELGEFDDAEEIAQQVLQWTDTQAGAFAPEVRARVRLTYGDIAFAKTEYAKARAIYESVVNAEEYKDTRAHQIGRLKVAEVFGATQEFDKAEEILMEIVRHPDKSVQADAHFALARLYMDQEDIDSAQEQLQQLFLIGDSATARVLEGQIALKRDRLDSAIRIQTPLSIDQKVLVPGRSLEMSLKDPSLATAGASSSIGIQVRAVKSGDVENFNLFPRSDDKTTFEGDIASELAPVRKGDHVLQVLGNDTVKYRFSDSFLSGANVDEQFRTEGEMFVLTDPKLFASAGKILTEAEEEELRIEAQIRKELGIADDLLGKMTLSARRSGNHIKPGNKVNVRVIDPDRSLTPEVDKLSVLASARSGDELRVELTETEPFSGIFEGQIPTASGQATAFASDTKEGSDPNFAISANESFGPWIGLEDGMKPKTFTIDLNDNVPLGKMEILAGETGRKLKAFTVQTSINGRDFTSVGSWPKTLEPWDGSMKIELAKLEGTRRPTQFSAFQEYMSSGYAKAGVRKVEKKIDRPAGEWGNDPAGMRRDAGISHRNDSYVAHIKGAFWLDRRQRREFRLVNSEPRSQTKYILAVNGKVQGDGQSWSEVLSRGVHRVDIFFVSDTNQKVDFDLMVDSTEPPYMIPAPKEMFDPGTHAQIKQVVYREPAIIEAERENSRFNIEFAINTNARIIRLVLEDFETDAPAIKKIGLTDINGARVLPTDSDFLTMKQNNTLEIVAGDNVTVRYVDPTPINDANKSPERYLTAMYSDADLSAAFVEYTMNTRTGERQADYIPMRRFVPGEPINVFINDPDMDVTRDRDQVSFTVTTDDGQPKVISAMETEENSGVFLANIVPVKTEPSRNIEVKIAQGQDLQLQYVDTENTDPGVPWKRIYTVEQAWYQQPELRLYDATSRELTETEKERVEDRSSTRERQYTEAVPVTRALVASRPEQPTPPNEPAKVVMGAPLYVEVLFPYRALSPQSELFLYAQSTTAREQMGIAEGQFDPSVPGTIKVMSVPSDAGGNVTSRGGGGGYQLPQGYLELNVQGDRFGADPLDAGRFTFRVPYQLGEVPPQTLVDEEPWKQRTMIEATPLSVQGDDQIVVGFQYEDPQGNLKWETRKVSLTSDVFFDVMDRRYQEVVDGSHVGEKLYFRVIHGSKDISDDKDTLTIDLASSDGVTKTIELSETFNHSGEFKGLVHLVYKNEPGAEDEINALPVDYGDKLTVSYQPYNGNAQPLVREVEVFKGSDGEVLPFTKRFKDPEIAVQTQFTVAESYFELAKKYRELENEAFARRSIAQGKKLLEEALRDYPDTEFRAQADYLLANLSFEYAKDAKNDELKQQHYADALARFSEIVAEYPESPYAPKSQFKKALVLEMKGEIDKACEEYVKLSYRYPENELVAQTIARLGNYFLTKGREFDEKRQATTEKVESEKIRMQAQDMYTTAAEVFGRLAVRFPQHNLATKTKVLSAQCYMRAESFDEAIEVFEAVYSDEASDNLLASESMYWAGDCYMKKTDAENAYRTFKKLTWDYPETVWAKYARGRLTEEALLRVGEQDASGR